MTEVLSVFTFGIGSLCFVVFVTVLKPNAISAIPGPSKPEYCNTERFACAASRPHSSAASSWLTSAGCGRQEGPTTGIRR